MKKIILVSIGIGVLVIALAVFFTYSSDQEKIKGFNFGNSLKDIQDDLKQTQNEFYSKKVKLDEDSITREEFLKYADTHIQNIQNILKRYDELSPPQSFVPSLKLFKSSTQKQLESDQFLIDWIRTNDTSNKVRSDQLLQESYDIEIDAISSFNDRKENPSSTSESILLIESNTEWSGAIQDGDMRTYSEDGSGNAKIRVSCNGSVGIVSVSFQKQTEYGHLQVSLIQDGVLLKSSSTSAQYGIAGFAVKCN